MKLASILLTFVSSSLLAVEVPQWQTHDFSFAAKTDAPNSFMVAISATVKGPDGKTWTLPGFYDGEGTWKIRVSPTEEGAWSLVTKSNVKDLDGQAAEFTCVKNANSNVHGVLRVDKEHPYHFIFDDGTRFFFQGYEYDWLWALDLGKPDAPTVKQTLDLIGKYGFNYVIINSYAHDTKWCAGNTAADDYGPPPLYAWEGSNDAPDHSRMNLAFWQHYDRVIAAMNERGIQAHMLMKVYNKQVKWPDRGSAEEELFLTWLVARYAAYPNVIWDFSKEAHNEKDLAYKQNWLKRLRELDPYDHLTTVHDDDKANDSGAYDGLTDFRTDQHHGNEKGDSTSKNSNRVGGNHEKILFQRARRAWPVTNVESDYEHGPLGLNDKTYGKAESPEDTLRTLWEIQMASGYTAYYYTYTAWDVIRPLDVPPGYAMMKHFGDFWRATNYWLLEPADKLVSAGWCLATPGSEYIVFQNKAQAFTLEINGAKAALQTEWFNPHTGKRADAGTLNNGTAKLTPPADWGDAPLVLHVRKP